MRDLRGRISACDYGIVVRALTIEGGSDATVLLVDLARRIPSVDDAVRVCASAMPEPQALWRRLAIDYACATRELMQSEMERAAIELAEQHLAGQASDQQMSEAREALYTHSMGLDVLAWPQSSAAWAATRLLHPHAGDAAWMVALHALVALSAARHASTAQRAELMLRTAETFRSALVGALS